MPFLQVVTRAPLSTETKARLAAELSATMLRVEIGGPTEAASSLDWIWFQAMHPEDWVVGGRLDDKYVNGRAMCFVRILAPEAFLNAHQKRRAIEEVTQHVRDVLVTDPTDDGTGLWVHLVEIPQGQWGTAGHASPLLDLIGAMDGAVSDPRRAEIAAYFKGQEALKSAFGIPD